MVKKDDLDRFYTKPEVVKQCLSLINFKDYDCIIEPSAGTGNFLKEFPADIDVFAFDISPEVENVKKQDWFAVDKDQFHWYKSILVCGNPPFGHRGDQAIRFFNEAAQFCNTIAFILPLSFKKNSIQNRLNKYFHLTDELILGDCEFLLKNEENVKVSSVFQVWKRCEKIRTPIKSKLTTDLFDFVSVEEADFRIQRIGRNAGKASTDLTKSANSNYFIKNKSEKTNEEFIDFINQLEFPSVEFTVGAKSLPKGELIEIIEENFKI